MRKWFIILLTVISSVTIFAENTKGIVHGKLNSGNAAMYNMRNIFIELKDENANFLKKAYIQPSRDFYFFDVTNGKYIIEVTAQGDTKRFYFEKKYENIYIGDISIEINENAARKNMFLNLLFGITALVNFIIIIFIRKGNEFENKKNVIIALYVYNIGYVLMFSGFILSFFENNFSYLLIPVAYFIWDILMIMLTLFFINYPVKNSSRTVAVLADTLIIYKFISSLLILMDRYYSNIFMVLNIVKDYRQIDILSTAMYYTAASSDIVITIFIAIILLKNVKQNHGSIEGMVSRFFARTFTVAIPLVVLADVAIGFTWPGRFEGYSEIVDSLFNLIIMMIMLLGVSGAKLLYKKKKNSFIFREVIKYYIFMLVLYGVVIFSEDLDYAVLMFTGVLIKLILDIAIQYFMKNSKINYEKSIAKLEAVIEPEDFARIASQEISAVTGSSDVKIIFNDQENREVIAKSLEFENKILSGKSFKNCFPNYDIGVKLEWEGEYIGIILIGNKNVDKNADIKEINFLINFSEELSKLAANMSVRAAKEKIEKEKYSCREVGEKQLEELMYIEKIAELIKKQSSEEKTVKLADTILKEINRAKGERENERN